MMTRVLVQKRPLAYLVVLVLLIGFAAVVHINLSVSKGYLLPNLGGQYPAEGELRIPVRWDGRIFERSPGSAVVVAVLEGEAGDWFELRGTIEWVRRKVFPHTSYRGLAFLGVDRLPLLDRQSQSWRLVSLHLDYGERKVVDVRHPFAVIRPSSPEALPPVAVSGIDWAPIGAIDQLIVSVTNSGTTPVRLNRVVSNATDFSFPVAVDIPVESTLHVTIDKASFFGPDWEHRLLYLAPILEIQVGHNTVRFHNGQIASEFTARSDLWHLQHFTFVGGQ